MFEAGMRTTLAQRLVSIVPSVFDQTCLTVWPLTSTLACLVTKQCLMVFGRQTFIVRPGPKPIEVETLLPIFYSTRIG